MDNPDLLTANAETVARLLGLLIPILVALVTKSSASSGLKGVLNFVGSALAGSTVYLVAQDGGYDWRGFVNASINTLLVSAASYYTLYKSTGVTDTINVKTGKFGIGRPPVVETDEKGLPASSHDSL